MDKKNILKAGKIASDIRKWIRPQIKKGVPLLDIAEKIEFKIIELGGKLAFPVNLSINEIAAHYTPAYNDETEAHGLLKIDFGVHVDGEISDTAFTMDLENSEENKKLIKASEQALENVIKIFKPGVTLKEIGKKIQKTIEENGFSPISNLTGHEIKKYELHAGLSIPNIDNNKENSIEPSLYAIEPFATTGVGKVHDGKPSGIYVLTNSKNIRSPIAREILNYIIEEYLTLPFCSRWLVKKFGTKSLFGLKQLEENGNIHHFPQLVETSGAKVAQAEHTVLVEKKETIVTTN